MRCLASHLLGKPARQDKDQLPDRLLVTSGPELRVYFLIAKTASPLAMFLILHGFAMFNGMTWLLSRPFS
jgi:hypothetical protein